jgi:hypothetical protein
MRTRSIKTILLVVALTAIALPGASQAQDEAAAEPQLSLEALLVEPSNPGPDTLCTLAVRVRNKGTETASQFGFRVSLNGEDLAVYSNQLFMYPVKAGESLEFPLYNFWTTETSRPTVPADGKLQLEVAIQESQWMKIEMEDEVEVWTPLGPVEGLPVGNKLTITVSDG